MSLDEKIKTNRQSNKKSDRQTGRQTDRQTDRQIDRQTDRQTAKGGQGGEHIYTYSMQKRRTRLVSLFSIYHTGEWYFSSADWPVWK